MLTYDQVVKGTRLFQIQDRQGRTIPFRHYDIQLDYYRNRSMRDVILKARQEGFSTGIDLEGLVQCLALDNQRMVIIAHDKESTQKLLARVKFSVADFEKRSGLRTQLRYESKNELLFEKTNSTIYVGTAGARKFGRGDTINFLHCSEYAFWPDPATTMSGLLPAAKYGRIIIESTANGKGNALHSITLTCLKNQQQRIQTEDGPIDIGWRLHFYPWHALQEYQLPAGGDFQLTRKELDVKQKHDLSFNQMAWYRWTQEDYRRPDGSLDPLFYQENPSDIEEAFLASGRSVFPTVTLGDKHEQEDIEGYFTSWEKPIPGHVYSAGIDVGAGTRGDDSVMVISDVVAKEVVGVLISNELPPREFGHRCLPILRRYRAFVTPEANTYGLAVTDVLMNNYPEHLIYHRDPKASFAERSVNALGFYTSNTSKMFLVAKGREAIDEGFGIHSLVIKDQLESFVEENGRLQAEGEAKDDCVIAFCLSIEGISQMHIPYRFVEDQTKDMQDLEKVQKKYTYEKIRKQIIQRKNTGVHA